MEYINPTLVASAAKFIDHHNTKRANSKFQNYVKEIDGATM